MNEGEIGETQAEKNKKRMVYINKDILVNKTLLSYDENTLIINNEIWNGNYYVEFSDSEGNETQLIVEIVINDGTTSGNIIKQTSSNYSIDNIETNDLGVSFDITDSNNNIVYAYRSKNIDDYEFINNNNDGDTNENTVLLGVHLSSGVVTIGEYAFGICTGLTQVTIPSSVETISAHAFRDCIKLEKVKILGNVKTIGEGAFYGCAELTQIDIPDSVNTIGNSAFFECIKLEKVVIPGNVNTISEYAFACCAELTQVEILKGTTFINEGAFSECIKLQQVIIPDSVEIIYGNVFTGCVELTEINIPKSVTAIDGGVFNGCVKLTKVTIRGTLTYVGATTFNTNPEPTTLTPRLPLIIQCNEDTKPVIAEAIKDTDYKDNITFEIVTESN